MSKRLEEIPYNIAPISDERIALTMEDYSWLIEQAERVQELERKNQLLAMENKKIISAIIETPHEEVIANIKKQFEALEGVRHE